MNVRIAVVEPDARAAASLREPLENGGYAVAHYATLGRFFDAIAKQPPEAVLLNMQLQGMEGKEILRALRANPGTRGLILIGVSGNPRTKEEVVAGFNAGADEYFFKPLDAELVVVRLRTLVARAPANPEEEIYRCAEIEVCPSSHTCTVAGHKVRLTRREFDLLLQFIRNPQRVLTRGNLIDTLWSGDASAGGRAVDRHMSALRTKLGASGRLIETVVGVGYRLSGAAVLSGNSK